MLTCSVPLPLSAATVRLDSELAGLLCDLCGLSPRTQRLKAFAAENAEKTRRERVETSKIEQVGFCQLHLARRIVKGSLEVFRGPARVLHTPHGGIILNETPLLGFAGLRLRVLHDRECRRRYVALQRGSQGQDQSQIRV